VPYSKTRSRAHKAQLQQALNPQQEAELVQYIEGLSERGLPPTRKMVRNFGSAVAQEEVSEAWVSRFLQQNNTHLTSKWTTVMNRNRHVADSEESYRRYFELLHSKMRQYNIEAENVYNMDEKSFFVGITGRSKRIFSKVAWQRKEKTQALQNDSREWITVIAAVCADGKTLPPTLIVQGTKGLQSTWVDDIKVGEHGVFLGHSPSGWSNNDLGLAFIHSRYTMSSFSTKTPVFAMPLLPNERGARRARLWTFNSAKNSKAPLYYGHQGRSGKPGRARA
jgi:hypothetical protein